MWNQLAEKYRDKPIIFLAVNSGNPKSAVDQYRRTTRFTWPILVDEFRRTEAAYGFEVSLRNIMVWRIIDAAGEIVGRSPDDSTIQKALTGASFTVLGRREFGAASMPAARALEWGCYPEACRQLAQLGRAGSNALKEDCRFLTAALNERARERLDRAKSLAAEGRKFEAYRLYESIARTFAVADAVKAAKAGMLELAKDAGVRRELTAYEYYRNAVKLLESGKAIDRQNGRALLEQVRAKFPGTEAARLCDERLNAPAN